MANERGGFGGPVLVTGATGFIGRHLCDRLVSAGADVHAVVRAASSSGAHLAGVTTHTVHDATAEFATVSTVVRPVVIFHLATRFAQKHHPTAISQMVDANVTFGAAVADAAVRGHARMVHATSAWQHYAGSDYSPVSLYAATKQALCDVIQYFAEMEGLVADEVCLFDTYGPRDPRQKLVWLLLEHAASGAPLPMSSGHQLVDLTHVEDVVSAFVGVATATPLGGRLVARSGHPITVRELTALVERVSGRPINAQWDLRPARGREMDQDWIVPGVSTSWRPRIDLQSGVADLWTEEVSRRA